MILALLRTDLFLVLGASFQTVLARNDDPRCCVFAQRDMLDAECASKSGIPVADGQPQVHPAPDKGCCGSTVCCGVGNIRAASPRMVPPRGFMSRQAFRA